MANKVNAVFAAVLKKSVDNKKISNSKLAKDFIESHYDAEVEADLSGINEATPEITNFITSFTKKSMKCSDKQLTAKFASLVTAEETAKAMAPKTTTRTTSYRGQEW